jgi:hypothetical protein
VNARISDIHALADQILELLGVRIPVGELVMGSGNGRVQKLETRTVRHPLPPPHLRVATGASRAGMNELTRASLQHLILETGQALETPIDFADLERRGVLARAQDGWFTLLKPKALPPYTWHQVTSLRARPMVRFNERDEDAR